MLRRELARLRRRKSRRGRLAAHLLIRGQLLLSFGSLVDLARLPPGDQDDDSYQDGQENEQVHPLEFPVAVSSADTTAATSLQIRYRCVDPRTAERRMIEQSESGQHVKREHDSPILRIPTSSSWTPGSHPSCRAHLARKSETKLVR